VGDAISQIFREEKLDVKISRFAIKNNWKDVVGEVIAKNTSDIFFNNKTIFITISNASLKHELSFRKDEILTNINKYAGYKLIETIVIK
jgi:predicted nucleic acid-binding Zn ribbon protein